MSDAMSNSDPFINCKGAVKLYPKHLTSQTANFQAYQPVGVGMGGMDPHIGTGVLD